MRKSSGALWKFSEDTEVHRLKNGSLGKEIRVGGGSPLNILLQMNLPLLIIETNALVMVTGYRMGIHHHYGPFNTEQTFDPVLLIYHDTRQTNLS